MKNTALVLTTGMLLSAFVLTGCSSIAAPKSDAGAVDVPGAKAEASKGNTVIYEVTSDAGTAGSIRYMTFNSGGPGQEQTFDAPLPFTNEMTLEDGGLFSSSTFSLTAAASAEATTISCKITANGEVIAEQTSTGAYSVVACSGSSE
ncbi:hypothetical protein E3O44_13350 [Cryobacterium algoricola]|uniref:MmpS family membrane protein n=1 Tax=Cryobacterium algoricola TaxID=1259183 RepID=A0ABY2ICZ1_9MICO|nr:MmpS family transport accessory protein [Cryobacterium algoricola]TFB85576.1 hypothetical protein E3O44_13350 [Cryobacterium algoricola]